MPAEFDEHHQADALLESGGNGLYSTLGDYLAFTQMLANGSVWKDERIIGRKTIDLMRLNHMNDAQMIDFNNSYNAGYGYGLGVRTMLGRIRPDRHGRNLGFDRSKRRSLRGLHASADSESGGIPPSSGSRSRLRRLEIRYEKRDPAYAESLFSIYNYASTVCCDGLPSLPPAASGAAWLVVRSGSSFRKNTSTKAITSTNVPVRNT